MASFPTRDAHPGAALTYTAYLDEVRQQSSWKSEKQKNILNRLQIGWAAIQEHVTPHIADCIAYHVEKYIIDMTSINPADLPLPSVYSTVLKRTSYGSITYPEWFFLAYFPPDTIFYPPGMICEEQEQKFYGPGVFFDLVPQSQRRTEIIKENAKAKPVTKHPKMFDSAFTSLSTRSTLLRQEAQLDQELAQFFSETTTSSKKRKLQLQTSEERLEALETGLTDANTAIGQDNRDIASIRTQDKDKDKDKIDAEEYHRRTVQAFRDQLTVMRTSLDEKVQGLRFKHDEDLQAVQKQTQDAIDQLAQELVRLRETDIARKKTMKTFFDKITDRIDGLEKKVADQVIWYKSNFTTLASGFRDLMRDAVGLGPPESGGASEQGRTCG
ncbi:hypothetical protein FPOA_04864 [Fusarium poae]|uniref:Uncharacterized protein n=1 Tax=Fusarium poae TaxID=36050 RepID=A0A1B8AUW0_FUSPO|nr:hypothetical protein FPOA_04864 [Fusarium poae]